MDDVLQVNGYPRYSPDEMDRRHRRLRELMEHHRLDSVLIGGATGPHDTSVQYYCNWPPLFPVYLIVSRDDDPELVVRLWNHIPDAERISVVENITFGGDDHADLVDRVARRLDGHRRIGTIGVVPYADAVAFGADRLVDLNADYFALRVVKTDEEMQYVRIASRMNDEAVAALASTTTPGMNEYELAKVIEDAYLDRRGTNLIHFTLTTSMANPEFFVPHQYQPDRIIQAGDVLVTEISTTFWGYTGQILRTLCIAGEPTSLYQEMYEVAESTYSSIAGIMRTGTTIGEILDRAEAIHEAGFDIWDDLVHCYGGGGYLAPIVRTRPNRGATHPDDWAYPKGTVLVVQPNVIDLPTRAGVQVGDSMWLRSDGVEVTQKHPRELIRCG
ncbi:M24 family metallopeptidase [Candidatus Poriferisocius sp.]|uniref:M24 family metallopeptidase n=1 Tax=Candidatus Poriferisocius sp. TaxID=3101276 RepID=UPI003B5C0540